MNMPRMREKPEITGSLRIPLEMIPQSLIEEFMDPMRSLPVMTIHLTRVIATDGISMQVGWEGSYTEFDFIANKIDLEIP